MLAHGSCQGSEWLCFVTGYTSIVTGYTSIPAHTHVLLLLLLLQAAYQEVYSFAMYGGAGSHSVAANLHSLKGSTGDPAVSIHNPLVSFLGLISEEQMFLKLRL
jgi:hypothetical protein